MKLKRFVILLAAFSLVATAQVARAQTEGNEEESVEGGPDKEQQPMSIENAQEEVSDTSDGFWIFDQAPLTGKIGTDRPAFSNSASLVPRGRFQLEGGYSFTYDKEHKRRTYDHSIGEFSLRTGLTDWLEFRVLWGGGSVSEIHDHIKTLAGRHVSHEQSDDGWRDLTVGLKAPILRDKENLPNISAIYEMTMPTGSGSKSANDVDHFFSLPWNYKVCERFTAYGSLAGAVLNTPDGQFFQGRASLGGAVKITDWMSFYAEYFTKMHASRHGDCSHLISAGPIFWITDNISIDTRVSAGLNEEAPDFGASIGMGIRF